MTDREKLIELLNVEIYPHEAKSPAEVVADYLLDNCVTFQRWIPVTERLPDKWRETDEEYFGEPIEFIVHICGAKCATTLCFDGTEFFDMTMGEIYPVSHWMPLPPAPKEVK